MAITKEKKTEILQELIDKFGRSKTIVFSDYRGLDVSSISDLRNRLREGGAECKVAKKTLMRLAAKESKIGELGDDVMEGPVSATFSYEDELAGLQILFKFSKENENLKLLGGIIDGKVVGAEEVIKLAKLPGKEELLAKLIGSMNAPLSGFVGILGNLIGGFVRVLNAYKDTLPAVAPGGAQPAEGTEAIETDKPASVEKPSEELEKPTDTVEQSPSTGSEPATGDAESEDQNPRPAETPEKEDEPADESKEEPTEETEDLKTAMSGSASPGQPAPVWTGRGDRPREQAREYAPDEEPEAEKGEEKSSSDESIEDKKEAA